MAETPKKNPFANMLGKNKSDDDETVVESTPAATIRVEEDEVIAPTVKLSDEPAIGVPTVNGGARTAFVKDVKASDLEKMVDIVALKGQEPGPYIGGFRFEDYIANHVYTVPMYVASVLESRKLAAIIRSK